MDLETQIPDDKTCKACISFKMCKSFYDNLENSTTYK